MFRKIALIAAASAAISGASIAQMTTDDAVAASKATLEHTMVLPAPWDDRDFHAKTLSENESIVVESNPDAGVNPAQENASAPDDALQISTVMSENPGEGILH